MANPYAPGTLIHESAGQPHAESPSLWRFLLKHFVLFEVSFVVIWLALICATLGMMKAIEECLAAPRDVLTMVTHGACYWLPHAFLAIVWRKMRRIRASLTAITGAAFFLVGILTFDLLARFLPQNLSISLSWTPTYVLLILWTALSLTAVCLLVRWRSGNVNNATTGS
ncbi:hypothetical protein SH528x_004546 [Novipirellula sp. SH528]|uniref:hypothetical protein n=1 Tax=Novipirellula sp. SH528 TaxID=3454466 RepID=UPI003F9F3154